MRVIKVVINNDLVTVYRPDLKTDNFVVFDLKENRRTELEQAIRTAYNNFTDPAQIVIQVIERGFDFSLE